MSAPVTDDGWGSPTLYNGGEPFTPRMFTEADPIGGVLIDNDVASEADSALVTGAPLWSPPTYTGRSRGPRRGPAAAPPEGVAHKGVAQPALDEPRNAATDAPVEENTTRGLMAASGSMAVASLASRITGFLRSILLVAALGIGAVGTAYNSGNNLPNMIYELLLGGVLSSVLIPLLVQAQAQDDDEGIAYTQRLLSIATAALGVMTMLAVLAAPWIAAAFVPAGPRRELTSIFATLLLPEIFFYGLGAMFVAVLNIRHSYKPGAWSPVLNNMIMIVTVGVFWALPGPATLNPSTMTTAQILVIGIGTTLGIAGQALVLIPSLRRAGFTWQWRFRARPNEIGRMREVGSVAAWVLGYVVVSQVGVSVIQKVGNDNGGFSVFTNADLLFQMPYGILVVSLLTAIMPRMSRAAVRGDNDAVIGDLSLSARFSAVALIPVTAGLIVLGPTMGVTLFAHGSTSIAGARLIGSSLAWSAFGLFPFALVMLQLRVFYAMRDGRTPTLINAFMVTTKVALILITNQAFAAPKGTNVILHPSVHAVEWLNIATSFSYLIGAIVGHVVLTRRLGPLGFGAVLGTVTRIAVASALGAAAAYAVVLGARHQFGSARLGSSTGLIGGALVGIVVLAVVAWRLRIPDVQQAVAAVRGR